MTAKRERPTSHSDRTAELLQAQEVALSQRSDDFRPRSASASKLDWSHKEPGYHYYWFSNAESSADTPTQGLELGYEFVLHPFGPKKGEVVEIKHLATTMTLMRVPDRIRQMTLDDRAAAVDRTDMGLNVLNKGEYGALENDRGQEGQGAAVRQDIEKSSSLNNPLMPKR